MWTWCQAQILLHSLGKMPLNQHRSNRKRLSHQLRAKNSREWGRWCLALNQKLIRCSRQLHQSMKFTILPKQSLIRVPMRHMGYQGNHWQGRIQCHFQESMERTSTTWIRASPMGQLLAEMHPASSLWNHLFPIRETDTTMIQLPWWTTLGFIEKINHFLNLDPFFSLHRRMCFSSAASLNFRLQNEHGFRSSMSSMSDSEAVPFAALIAALNCSLLFLHWVLVVPLSPSFLLDFIEFFLWDFTSWILDFRLGFIPLDLSIGGNFSTEASNWNYFLKFCFLAPPF